jgi:FdrA protein
VVNRVTVSRAYHDSVTLMLASQDAGSVDGVTFAAAAAATPVNLELLAGRSFDIPTGLGPDDLIVAIEASDADALEAAVAAIDTRLTAVARPSSGSELAPARTLRSAAGRDPALNLALISVPGRFAANEMADALDGGLNVFCFSDGVAVGAERELKLRGRELGLLVMGPDCGTAIVGGVGLGFANVVQRGPVGIVGASGTGTQAICCLLDHAGVGISHAIGVGGRDLSAEVGGIMTLEGLSLLAADDATELIVVVSKPPAPDVAAEVIAYARSIPKPVVLALLGSYGEGSGEGAEVVTTLEEAARRAAALAGSSLDLPEPEIDSTPGSIVGLFTGGTLCSEAEGIVAAATRDHRFTDFGRDELTAGRPHPMIDPTLRNEMFRREATDGSVGVILIDVMLGLGAHPDPAAALAPLVKDALRDRAGSLGVVAVVCGTRSDPQGTVAQIAALEAAGATVTRSSTQAARLALEGVVS